MNKPKLPPVLSQEDFDSSEEYEYYLASEKGEFLPVSGTISEAQVKWRKSASATINGKRERITIAVPARNLARIRSLALRRGIPYQTLINETLNDLAKQSVQPFGSQKNSRE